MKTAYVTVLSTDSYLPGVLVLHSSLQKTHPQHSFLTLLSPNISDDTRATLEWYGIPFRSMDGQITNPHDNVSTDDPWYHTYAKIGIFGLSDYDKLVYLDADMMVLENLDELFERPHMSGVNAGGMLPENAAWTELNSGLMVVEPSDALFHDMLSKIGRIEQSKKEADYSDQGFLQCYYPDWPYRSDLHLSHAYNMFDCTIERYRELFGFWVDALHPRGGESVKIIHFIGRVKPWHEHPGWGDDDLSRSRRLWLWEFESML